MGLDRAKTKANIDKFVRANKIPEAIREVQKLVEDNPRDTATLQQLANLYLRVQNKDAAIPIFIRIAELYQKAGFTPKALASIRIALREDPDNTQAQELFASFAEQTGMQRDAIEAFEKLVSTYTKGGLLDNAEKILNKLLELSPESVRYQLQHGDLSIRLNKKEQAVPSYLKAAENLVNQGMIKEAAKIFERVLQIDPKKLQVLEQLIKNLLAQKESNKAIELLDGIVQGKPSPPIINELRVDIYTALGNYEKAGETLKSLLEKSPLRGGLLGKFLRLHLAQKKFEEAAQTLRSQIETVDPGALKEFEGCFEEILSLSPGSGSAYEGLLEVYRKLGNDARLQATLIKYGDILISAGDSKRAGQIIREALTFSPNDNTLMLKLESIEDQSGGRKATASAKEQTGGFKVEPAAPVEDAPEVEIEVEIEDISPQSIVRPEEIEVTSTFATPPPVTEDFSPVSEYKEGASSSDEEQESSIEFSEEIEEEPEPKEYEGENYQESMQIGEPEKKQPEKPPKKLDGEAAGKIQERLSEAQIFLKYGLVEKAIGELQAVLKEVPDHIQAHQKLIGIYRSLDKKDKLVRQILKLAQVFKDQSDKDTCDNLVDEARQIDPNHKSIIDFVDGAPQAAKAPDKIENIKDIDSLAESFRSKKAAQAPPASGKAVEEEPMIIEEEEAQSEEDIVIEIGEPEPAVETEPEKFVEVDESGDKMVPQEELESVQELSPVDFSEKEEESLHVEISPEEVSKGSELSEKLEEAEFYYAQELWDDADRIASELNEKYPADLRVQNVVQRLAKAGRKSAPEEPAAAAGKKDKTGEFAGKAAPPEDGGLSLLDKELVQDLGGVVPAERKKSRVKVTLRDIIPEGAQEKKEEKEVFQESGEEYYDLAKELGAALEGLEGTASDLFDDEDSEKSPEEMSFEEVFKEFKKGVEKKVSEEDYDTHYNLGIAYKEMELLEEAIGEFQIAARSPMYFADACSMLGKCFQVKGMLDLSEKWYRKGLDSKGFAEEVYNGLRYDLAELLQEMGNEKEALRYFKEVYAANANYREVKERIESLT
jgi:tetratricopeptide (TPR) repeat protein